ncbi:hypothetical protein TNCV_2822401 [Trichonephila clavipes]|nr:hypothetical protein TNCV_2822401 [Trichonephila clavipes]
MKASYFVPPLEGDGRSMNLCAVLAERWRFTGFLSSSPGRSPNDIDPTQRLHSSILETTSFCYLVMS